MFKIEDVRRHYDQLKIYGPYATLAPGNRGGAKSRYVTTVFDETLLPYFKDAGHQSVLDLGCADGAFSNRVARHTRLAVGADISTGMLDLAKERTPEEGKVDYVQIDGKRLPFKDSQFHSIITRESLCHVTDEDFSDILSEIERVLCDDGRFFMLEQVSESPYWRTQGEYTIRRSFKEIIEQGRSSGFQLFEARVVRKPRFFWIYLFWFRLLPEILMPLLARLEVRFNKHFFRLETKRWHDVLFIFGKNQRTGNAYT